jgi:hypothetical protein
MMMPFPSRDDVAMALIMRACGHTHDFPDDTLQPTGTDTDASGRTVNVSRITCRRCGMLKVSRWHDPDPSQQDRYLAVISSYEWPEPGEVPGIAERALRVTDAEFAEIVAERGFAGGVPAGFAPDRRTTAAPERLDVVLRIRAAQFYALDQGRSIGQILPIPPHAESADLIEAIPGAALLWAPIHEGELPLTVVISAQDPEPDRSYQRIVELSCRFHSGHIVLRELAGRELPLPPLPAGHGDYRLRFHQSSSGCLLQIWNRPRTKPLVYSPTTP